MRRLSAAVGALVVLSASCGDLGPSDPVQPRPVLTLSSLPDQEPLGEPVAVATEAALRTGNSVQETPTLPPPPTEPPVPVFSGDNDGRRCLGAEALLAYYSPGWDVVRMSRIMWRESRCLPDTSNSCCSGLLQMHRMHVPNHGLCGVYSRSDYYDPVKNICAAAILWQASGYGAWSQTD